MRIEAVQSPVTPVPSSPARPPRAAAAVPSASVEPDQGPAWPAALESPARLAAEPPPVARDADPLAAELGVIAGLVQRRGLASLLATPMLVLRGLKRFLADRERLEYAPGTRDARISRAERELDSFVRAYTDVLKPKALPPGATGLRGRPLVFVHGLTGSESNWADFVAEAVKRGRPAYARTLGAPGRALDRYAAALTALIEDAVQEHPEADGVDLVAHSLGGLVVRECLARNPALAARVKGVVTLATPHQGTLAANFCLPVPEAKALRRSGPDVARPPALRDCAGDARVLTLIGDDDLLVYPQESSQQTGAAHQVLAGHGHFSLLYGADAIDRTLEFLAAG